MSCALPSDLITAIRERIKPYAHNGMILSPDEVCAFLRNLRTIEEVARDLEEDCAAMELRLGTRRDALRDRQPRRLPDLDPSGNVVRFRTRPRLVAVTSDGGDAA